MKPTKAFAVALLGGACVQASAVTVISSSYRVWGNWSERYATYEGDWENPQYFNPTGTHDVSGSGPLFSGGIGSEHGWHSAWASMSQFSLSMWAYSWPHGLDDGDGFAIMEGHVEAFATVTTRFTVGSTQAAFSLISRADYDYYLWEQRMGISLKNLSTGAVLFDADNLVDLVALYGEPEYSLLFNLATDPAHDYELTLSGWIYSFDAKYVDMWTGVDISSAGGGVRPVPDSGGTAVMLSLGLAVLFFWGAGRSRDFFRGPPDHSAKRDLGGNGCVTGFVGRFPHPTSKPNKGS